MTVLPQHVVDHAERILTMAKSQGYRIATAESCTGGLISAIFTEVAGSSSVFERGYATYSNLAKQECLGVPWELIERHGAVSEEVCRSMAAGALIHSEADVSVAVTGIAGPTGGTREKPVGTVHMACGLARGDGEIDILHEEHRFGDVGRSLVRLKTIEAALVLLENSIDAG